MDIEITSLRPDGNFTWRVAGAREPKGVVEASIVKDLAKVGEVVKAEVDQGLDGVSIVALVPRRDRQSGDMHLEIHGGRKTIAGVTTTLAKKDAKDKKGRRGDKRGPSDKSNERSDKFDARKGRSKRPTGEVSKERRPNSSYQDRLKVASIHRDALLVSLSPQEQPIAEHLIEGGMPAVRTAITNQISEAKKLGQPPILEAPLLAIAERLLPSVRLAIWRDRADACKAAGADAPLRDLRSLVSAVPSRGEDEKALVKELKGLLDVKVKKIVDSWRESLTKSFESGDLLQTLELASSPPDTSASIDQEFLVRLSESVSEKLHADENPEKWITLVESAASSPVRRQVKPKGIPDDPTGEAQKIAKKYSGMIPALAPMVGLRIPPPPRVPGGMVVVSRRPEKKVEPNP
ncbi:MAG: hypothetical protein HKL80_01585 [Acidimicrobiales bacterium]|nr:hypothetical protein [Acidimicrobiales bacterium]